MKKLGRPPKFHKKFIKKIIEYFDIDPISTTKETFYYKNGDEKVKEIEVAADLPTIKGFAKSIGVTEDTIVNWTKKNKDFLGAYKRAKEMQEDIWMRGSLKGLYNPQFAIFMGKNVFNWKDKSEVDSKHTGSIAIKRVSNLK